MSTYSAFAPLSRKLARLGLAPENPAAFIAGLTISDRVRAGQVVVRQGGSATHVIGLLSGMMARTKLDRRGRRQILAFCTPGDLCASHAGVAPHMDHGVMALSECRLALMPRPAFLDLLEQQPMLAMAFWRNTVADGAVDREWIFNLGRRGAVSRLAHVFCETHLRLEYDGAASPLAFTFPVTQVDLGDAMGLSTVHVNRSLQALRHAGLLTLSRGVAQVLDRKGLRQKAEFEEGYLGLQAG